MKVKAVVAMMLGTAVIAGGALWYLQTRVYYHPVPADQVEDVQLTSVVTGQSETIGAENIKQISGPHMPLRYRACFDTGHSLAMLTETYQIHDTPEPLIAPGWFTCFDAKQVGAALQDGRAIAFMSEANIVYGVDRVAAITEDGQGYAWHQLNPCGAAFYNDKPVPQSCPPAPEKAE